MLNATMPLALMLLESQPTSWPDAVMITVVFAFFGFVIWLLVTKL